MKNLTRVITKTFIAGLAGLFAATGISCHHNHDTTEPPNPAAQQSFTMVNMVASDASFAGARVDAHLINAWGLAFSSGGTAWISATDDHTSAVYNGATGAQQLAAVTVPAHGAATGGTPTGQVFNSNTAFPLVNGNGNPARFIFANEDGVISGWNGGAAAVMMVDRNATSVYTGLAIGNVATDTFLYAADFKSKKIDMFSRTMVLQPAAFVDAGLPAGYTPFNIQNIGGMLYVTYAQVDATTGEEKKGVGLGIVNVFNPNGTLVKRLVTGGKLNAPWGVAQAPANWLTNAGASTVILVGNFGDGHINAYDATTNAWLGTLTSNGTVITIDGLWALSFKPATAAALNGDWLYFTAGPADETKGLFGYVTK